MKKFNPLALSFISGILLFAAWPLSPLTFFIFFGFVPLLLLSDYVTKAKRFFGHAFVAMLIFNTATTWWIWNSTDVGSIAAIAANSFLMSLPLLAYYKFKKRFGKYFASFSFIVFWMSFEYIHLNWQLSWPWLTLGNVFAAQPGWIQWYEFSGVGGGSLWVLLLNIFFYHWISGANYKIREIGADAIRTYVNNWRILIIAPAIFLPMLFSIVISISMALPPPKHNVVIVQPNIDPYSKFENNSAASQLNILLSLTEKNIDSATSLVIWPETALSYDVQEHELQQNLVYQPLFSFLKFHPDISILSGISTYKYVNDGTQNAARKLKDGSFIIAYNTAVMMHDNVAPVFYHKSKLVPGVETLPTFLNFMAPLFEQFGGSAAGYGKSDSSIVLQTPDSAYKCATVICYESIYGEYVASYVKRGANIITIMTNDGWWGNTPGHRQHLAYAKLRAIETRKWVVRSANTGISAVITPYGNVKKTLNWNEANAIKFPVPVKRTNTFYVTHGDYLFKAATVLALVLLAVLFIFTLFVKQKQANPRI